MADDQVDDDAEDDEISTQIKTDVDYDGKGTLLAVQTVSQGKRRLDWLVGFADGSFAEGHNLYFDGELLKRAEELMPINEWPSGKLNEEGEFFRGEIVDVDDDGNVQQEYDQAQDAVQRATEIIETGAQPETILNEWWEDQKEMYDESTD